MLICFFLWQMRKLGLQSETGVHPCVRKDGGSVHRKVYGSWEGTIVLTMERTGSRCGQASHGCMPSAVRVAGNRGL